ncbi:MAG: methanogenesis marker protein Mmp4/MtxX [Promethearchaeota archaeon]
MKIIQKYELEANKKKDLIVGIGIGDSEYHNQKIHTASLKFSKKFKTTVLIFGKKNFIDRLRKGSQKNKLNSQVKFIECLIPERTIIEFLINNSIQAIVRGSLSSSKFLENLKRSLNLDKVNRLALLETVKEHQFFFGPIGIDECTNLKNKLLFLDSSLKEIQDLDIIPKVSILSGGRLGDIGRDVKVDQTIQDAEKIVNSMKNKYPNLMISHDEILIEKAVENGSNLIIAPDGVSGNLIYRTLVHLGGGKAYGAIYMGFEKSIIDTSRVGDQSEIYGALVLSLALAK